MTSTPQSGTLLSPAVLRAVYRRGMELRPGERALFEVLTGNGKAVRLSVANGSEGLVEVACADKLVCAQLRNVVGMSVVLREVTTRDALSTMSIGVVENEPECLRIVGIELEVGSAPAAPSVAHGAFEVEGSPRLLDSEEVEGARVGEVLDLQRRADGQG